MGGKRYKPAFRACYPKDAILPSSSLSLLIEWWWVSGKDHRMSVSFFPGLVRRRIQVKVDADVTFTAVVAAT